MYFPVSYCFSRSFFLLSPLLLSFSFFSLLVSLSLSLDLLSLVSTIVPVKNSGIATLSESTGGRASVLKYTFQGIDGAKLGKSAIYIGRAILGTSFKTCIPLPLSSFPPLFPFSMILFLFPLLSFSLFLLPSFSSVTFYLSQYVPLSYDIMLLYSFLVLV